MPFILLSLLSHLSSDNHFFVYNKSIAFNKNIVNAFGSFRKIDLFFE